MKNILLLKMALIMVAFLFVKPVEAGEFAAYTDGTQVVVASYIEPTEKVFVDFHPGFVNMAEQCNYPYIIHAQISKYGDRHKVAIEAVPGYDPDTKVSAENRKDALTSFVSSLPHANMIVTCVGVEANFIELVVETDEAYFKVIANKDESLGL